MNFLFFSVFFLFSFPAFSQSNDEFKKEFEKFPKAQKEEILQILIMRAQMEQKDAQITPEITITGQEGFKFKTQNPVVLEDADEIWKKYRNPKFEKVPLALYPLHSSTYPPIEYQENRNSKYTFRHYPLGSEFTIKSFIHIGSGWMFILTDKTGNDMLVEDEYALDRMLDGDGSTYYSGGNLMYLYWNSNGKTHQTVKAHTWQLTGLHRFVEAIRKGDHRIFPVFKDRKMPSPEPKTKGEWINYFLKGVIGKTANITNERNENHITAFEIEADTDVLMFLVYANFIQPSERNEAFARSHRFQNQDETKLISNVLHHKRKRSEEEKEEMEKWQRLLKERDKDK